MSELAKMLANTHRNVIKTHNVAREAMKNVASHIKRTEQMMSIMEEKLSSHDYCCKMSRDMYIKKINKLRKAHYKLVVLYLVN